MLLFRPFKTCDAEKIVSWVGDERSFRQWSSDRYEAYPITAADMIRKYADCNGDCQEEDNFYPMTACDESGAVVGHLMLRYVGDRKKLRIGFVIVDPARRGKGYGAQMVRMAVKYGFEYLGGEKITLGVFDNNPAALHCYLAAGFQRTPERDRTVRLMCENWTCLELAIEKGKK